MLGLRGGADSGMLTDLDSPILKTDDKQTGTGVAGVVRVEVLFDSRSGNAQDALQRGVED